MYQDAILLIADWATFDAEAAASLAGTVKLGNGGAVAMARLKAPQLAEWQDRDGVQVVAVSEPHDASHGAAIGAALIAGLTEAQQEALETVIDLSPRSDGEGGTVQPTLASEMVLIQ